MSGIQLNFINQSNDINNSQVVIFQSAPSADAVTASETAVAWKVLSSPRGSNSTIVIPDTYSVGGSDSFGNQFTPRPAVQGQRFDVVNTISGPIMQLSSLPAGDPKAIEVHNELPIGAITAMLFCDGKIFGEKVGITPGQMAQFMIYSAISIGIAPNVKEGEVMNTGVLSTVNHLFSLEGIVSADIVLTGGGSGTTTLPYQLTMQNVKYAAQNSTR